MIGGFIGIHVSFLDSYIAVHKFDLAPLQKHLLVQVQLCNRLLLVVFWVLAYSLLQHLVVFRTVPSCHFVL